MTSIGRNAWVLVASLALLVPLCGGCDREESASNAPAAQSSGESSADGGEDAGDADDAGTDDSADPDAGDGGAPPAAPQATVPTPDVPVPPTVEGEVTRQGFVFFAAKDLPRNVAGFYQKELEAKGWKSVRNQAGNIANLANIVQEYARGNDVLTVVLQEQIGSEENLTTAQIMDIPLPPNAEQVVPLGVMASMNVPGTSDEALGWFNKALTARGWSAQKVREQQNVKSQSFRKGDNRTLTVISQQFPGRKDVSVQLQHIAYAQ